MTEISKILIANRGEIACRVIRTARSLGIKTVAVYSDADAGSPHTQLADETRHIGASPVGESYLVLEKIITAARDSGADAIHPGYGFLSENAAFSKACADNDILFIGPPELAINVMGDKARSKRAMLDAGVPCVPGYQDEDQSDETLIAAANKIGLPVMIKAAAGGGGRGMRLVHKAKDLSSAIKLARSEAENAFGSGVLIIEKAIQRPRHVEIQVFADAHGNVIHLGERDCSVQRRHQKVIEEAPCPVMTPKLREEMGAAAIAAAQAVDYRGAGTVEFLLDADGAFYFLEMNTRLQVEHPVTEAVTGLDLVAMQIAVAEGKPIVLSQDDVRMDSHAIEVRLYAEDPENDFLPSTGSVLLWSPPEGEGIRVDDGIATGSEISPFYDAMVAKIIATGDTRAAALRRLQAALETTALFGLASNRDFLIDAISQPAFRNGEATTAFIAETYGDAGFQSDVPGPEVFAAAIALDVATQQDTSYADTIAVHPELLNWSSTRDLEASADYQIGDTCVSARTSPTANGTRVDLGDATCDVMVQSRNGTRAELSIDGKAVHLSYMTDRDGAVHIATGTETRTVENLSARLRVSDEEGGGGTVLSPMHGKLLELTVSKGDTVSAGQKLAVLEAMKMQHEIIAAVDGIVATVAATIGEQIAADELILEIETEEGE
ncbi:MAG: acetyl-CoA carboxylase biotin carboxylase subunit [Pseudomonadota bacterium]